jgi:hypothetical protein
MLKAYQAKGDTLDESYVSMDQIWNRVSFSSGSGDFLTYTVNGVENKYALGELSKEIVFQDQTEPKSLTFVFTNDEVALTKTVTVENNSYPFTVSWTLMPLRAEITNASLYLTTNFDLQYTFDKVDIPGLMDWVNPWDAPGPIRTTNGNLGEANSWAVASFAGVNLKDNYIGLYDDTNNVGYAYKFNDIPDWGNIGALGNRQIDAVRFQYKLGDLAVNQTVTRSYETLALSRSSYSELQPSSLQGLFNYTTVPFKVTSRDFSDSSKKTTSASSSMTAINLIHK